MNDKRLTLMEFLGAADDAAVEITEVPQDMMDTLFRAAALEVLPPATDIAIPHALIFHGANLGFTLGQGKIMLDDHPSMIFLGRLWDARRVDNVIVGGSRVPQRIWELAQRDDCLGMLHTRLLESTGMRAPRDLLADLELHLTLAVTSSNAVRGRLAPSEGESVEGLVDEASCNGGPFAVRLWRSSTRTLRLQIQSSVPGLCVITLFWPHGPSRSLQIHRAHPGQFETELEASELPSSIRLDRRSRNVA